jgi:hypothetical protein
MARAAFPDRTRRARVMAQAKGGRPMRLLLALDGSPSSLEGRDLVGGLLSAM